MPQARDEAGNLWDVTDPDNPVLVQAASAGRIIPAPVDPYEGPKAAADLANTRDLIDSRRRDDERADRVLTVVVTRHASSSHYPWRGLPAAE